MTQAPQAKGLLLMSLVLIMLSSCAHTHDERSAETGLTTEAMPASKTAAKTARASSPANGTAQSLEQARSKADRAFARGDFAAATKLYEALLHTCRQSGHADAGPVCDETLIKERARTSRLNALRKQVGQALGKGDVQRAIEACRKACAQSPGDAALLHEHAATLNQILNIADRHYENADFTLAGKTYVALSRNYPSERQVLASIGYDKDMLQRKTRDCRDALFRNALEEYRKSNIDKAISLWQGILTFYPEDENARKALATALHQARNLRNTPN